MHLIFWLLHFTFQRSGRRMRSARLSAEICRIYRDLRASRIASHISLLIPVINLDRTLSSCSESAGRSAESGVQTHLGGTTVTLKGRGRIIELMDQPTLLALFNFA